jgi:cytochrome c-type biogenesis protein CcmH/NrfG
MAVVDVKIVCGACGAGVAAGAATCPSCGAGLRFPTSVRQEKKPQARKERNEPGKRTTEPWMVIAAISVLVLIGYVVYNAATTPASTPSAVGGPVVTPAMPPAVGQGPDLQGLEDAVRMRPADTEALLRLANAYHDAGRWEQAVMTYGKYLEARPGDPDARVDMGVCYFEWSKSVPAKAQEYRARAIAEMKRALKEHPQHQAAAFNLGIVSLNSGDVRGSSEWFRRAAEMDGSTPLGQKARAMLEQHSFNN